MSQSFQKREGVAPKAVVLREEFVALTHDPLIAIVLNQLMYWTQRVKDFDLFLEEEQILNPDCNVKPRHGWIYKTANDLIIETMICVDRTTMRRYLKTLIEHGWLEERSNPHHKWDKTSQYRLNVRNLRNDLFLLGFTLPGLNTMNSREGTTDETEDDDASCDDAEMAESSIVQNAPSNGHPSEEQIAPSNDFDVQDHLSKEDDSASKEQNAPSKEINSSLYIQRIQSENKNREDNRETRAREKFSDSENSLAEEMVALWEQHLDQKVLHLTEERKSQLESLFAFYFQNDIRKWEEFILRIKGTPFLMGENPRNWYVKLDWILSEGNLLKVLERNYDDSSRLETQCDWKLEPLQPNPIRDAEKAAVIASIKDPVWKNWCSQLAEGVRYNERVMQHKPLSVSDLQDIANAHFLECEDERLVWVGSSDQRTLNRIETLRLDISWVFKKEYPKARTFRTRLVNASPSTIGGSHV